MGTCYPSLHAFSWFYREDFLDIFEKSVGTTSASQRHMSDGFTYRDLETWKQGMDLVEVCYRATVSFPKSEIYGLTGQIRRAACSIPSNVAEGHCRRSTKAYANHVAIALGSHGELETCTEIAARLGFLSEKDKQMLSTRCDSVGRLLNGLYSSLERKLLADSDA
jgi:four helix bundle protein